MPDATTHAQTISAHAGVPERLQSLIQELHQAYESLDRLTDVRRGAVSSADLRALSECVRSENDVVQRIAALDGERELIVRLVAQESRLDPTTATITQISSLMPEPWRSELLDSALRLRTIIDRVHRKNEASKLAAEKLARHMQGLLLAAERQHSHAGVYGRRGDVRTGKPVVTALDCTS